MATKVGFQLESSLASKHLTDAEFIKGGYLVVNSIAERDSLVVATESTDGTIIKGSLCYCTEDEIFYQYNGISWVVKEFGTNTEATVNKAGLMSAADKANLDVIVGSFNSEDSNTTIDTIKETLKAFENAPEGTNIANALASKADKEHTHSQYLTEHQSLEEYTKSADLALIAKSGQFEDLLIGEDVVLFLDGGGADTQLATLDKTILL